VSVIVKLFSHLTVTFKKLNVGPEILEWITEDGKEVFENCFLIPLARRYSKIEAGFKNWPAICTIDNWCLRMAIARVDIKSEWGVRLQTAFPECFTGEKVNGPVPLSALQEVARDNNVKYNHREEAPGIFLFTMDALEDLSVPNLIGCWDPESHKTHLAYSTRWILFEDNFPRPDHFGEMVMYKGEKYFVAELDVWPGPNRKADQWCCLVPIECIDPTK